MLQPARKHCPQLGTVIGVGGGYVVIAPDFIAEYVDDSGARDQFHLKRIAELQARVKGLLAPYEYPKEIEFVDALPMTTTGKVQRRVLCLQKEERAQDRAQLTSSAAPAFRPDAKTGRPGQT